MTDVKIQLSNAQIDLVLTLLVHAKSQQPKNRLPNVDSILDTLIPQELKEEINNTLDKFSNALNLSDNPDEVFLYQNSDCSYLTTTNLAVTS